MKRTFAAFLFALALAAPAAFAQARGDMLDMGKYLRSGEYLVAWKDTHFAIMQGDGNFCIYKGSDPGHNMGNVWCSGIAPGNGDYFAIMQADANFCVYRGTGPADNKGRVWCSMKTDGAAERYYLTLAEDVLSVNRILKAPPTPFQAPPFVPPFKVWASREVHK